MPGAMRGWPREGGPFKLCSMHRLPWRSSAGRAVYPTIIEVPYLSAGMSVIGNVRVNPLQPPPGIPTHPGLLPSLDHGPLVTKGRIRRLPPLGWTYIPWGIPTYLVWGPFTWSTGMPQLGWHVRFLPQRKTKKASGMGIGCLQHHRHHVQCRWHISQTSWHRKPAQQQRPSTKTFSRDCHAGIARWSDFRLSPPWQSPCAKQVHVHIPWHLHPGPRAASQAVYAFVAADRPVVAGAAHLYPSRNVSSSWVAFPLWTSKPS